MRGLDTLSEWSEQNGLSLTSDFQAKISTFKELLYLWNQKHNLTRIAEQDFERFHVIDSLSVASSFRLLVPSDRVLDIGTGAGFPGIPLALAFPQASFTLVDKSQKRIVFLEQVIASLGLNNVQALHCRLEDLANNSAHKEAYSVVTSRALAPLVSLLSLAKPFCASDGTLVFLKSQSVHDELAFVLDGLLDEQGVGQPELVPYRVPGREEDDIIAIFRVGLVK